MKKLSTVIVIGLLTIGFNVNAQKSIQVSETNESFSTGNQKALSVMIYGADEKDVEKEWKKRLKDLKGKVNRGRDEMFADDCEHKKMGDNTFDVYTKVLEKGEHDIKLVVAVNLGGAYMNSSEHSDKYKVFEEIMYEFAVEQTKEAMNGLIEEQEEKLEDLVDEKEDLEKDNEKLKDDIEDYKKSIKKAEEEIEENTKSKEEKIEAIKEQEAVVKELKKKQEAVK